MTDFNMHKACSTHAYHVHTLGAAGVVLAGLLVGGAARAEQSAGAKLLSQFKTECIDMIAGGVQADHSHLAPMTEDQHEQLAKKLGEKAPAGGAYALGEDVYLFEFDGANVCQIVEVKSTDIMLAEMQELEEAWPEWFGSIQPIFRAKAAFELGEVRTAQGRRSAGVFAARPDGDGFLQMTVNFNTVEDKGMGFLSMLVYRVGKPPASCELWPEECN